MLEQFFDSLDIHCLTGKVAKKHVQDREPDISSSTCFRAVKIWLHCLALVHTEWEQVDRVCFSAAVLGLAGWQQNHGVPGG